MALRQQEREARARKLQEDRRSRRAIRKGLGRSAWPGCMTGVSLPLVGRREALFVQERLLEMEVSCLEEVKRRELRAKTLATAAEPRLHWMPKAGALETGGTVADKVQAALAARQEELAAWRVQRLQQLEADKDAFRSSRAQRLGAGGGADGTGCVAKRALLVTAASSADASMSLPARREGENGAHDGDNDGEEEMEEGEMGQLQGGPPAPGPAAKEVRARRMRMECLPPPTRLSSPRCSGRRARGRGDG